MIKYYFSLVLLIAVSCFSAFGDTWTQKASLPSFGRDYCFSFSIGIYGYFGGGAGTLSGVCYNDLWEYNSVTDSWTQKADVGNRCRFTSVGFSIDGKGYVCGGSTTTSDTLKDLYEFDPTANVWLQKADMLEGLKAPSCFVISNKAYIVFGSNFQGQYSNQLYEYDPLVDTWTVKAPVPSGGRVEAPAFSIGNTGYTGLGTDFGSLWDDWYAYDQPSNTWQQKNSLGLSYYRFSNTSFSIGNYGYVVCGIGLSMAPDVLKYNPLTDSWYYKLPFPGGGRTNPASFVINNLAYVGTGADSSFTVLNDLWVYTPDSITSDVKDFNALEFSIFPNPFNSTLSIISSNAFEINYKVFDLLGNMVLEGNWLTKKNELDLKFLNEGCYFLTIANESGTSSRKIVKISER